MKAVAAILGLAVILAGCQKKQDRNPLPDFCYLGELCNVGPPPAFELSIANAPVSGSKGTSELRKRGIDRNGLLYQVVPKDPWRGWFDDRVDKGLSPALLFYVTTDAASDVGELWIEFAHGPGEHPEAQLALSGMSRQRHQIMVDGETNLLDDLPRFAVVERQKPHSQWKGSGPTFVWFPPDRRYVRFEYDSPYVRKEWENGIRSSCVAGPLTEVPRRWYEERERLCRRRS